MAIDRTVKFTVRLNMLNPAHVTINKVLNELNLDIFKSKNQFFIDAATYYIENYGQEELTQPKKEKEPEFVSTEDMEAIEERIRQAAKEEARQEANKEVMTMVGFLDGINESLINENPIETMEEDTEVNLIYDKGKTLQKHGRCEG